MNFARRDSWPMSAREGIAGLDSRDIPHPKPVAVALATLERIEAAKPATPDPVAVRNAIREGADADAINGLLIAELIAPKLAIEWNQARIDAAGGVLAAILASAGEILPAITEQAQAAIDKLKAVADLQGARLEDLVRDGRHDAAQAVANVGAVAATLDAAYNFRDTFLTRGGPMALTVSGVNCSRWADPVLANHRVSGSTPAERYLRGLSAGLELHFPTPNEAIQQARAIADAQAAEQAQVKAAQHGVGSVASWG